MDQRGIRLQMLSSPLPMDADRTRAANDRERYKPLSALWRDGEVSMRLRRFLSSADPEREFEQLAEWIRHSPPRFGDAKLRFAGIGEVVHFGCHDFEGLEEFAISDEAAQELGRITARVTEGGPMNIHVVLDESIDRIPDCWEAGNGRIPLRGLRFSLSHGQAVAGGWQGARRSRPSLNPCTGRGRDRRRWYFNVG